MVGVHITATPDAKRAAAANKRGNLGIALFHQGSASLPGLGGALHNYVRKKLPRPPTQLAWDFLSLAMAIFAADRFVLRSDTQDGWTRIMALDIAVSDAAHWQKQADKISAAMRFLTGDIWYISFSAGGDIAPAFNGKLSDRDTVCLFSGGLDSLLGAAQLLDKGHTPLLVSQGSTKEITPQTYLSNLLGLDNHRFEARIREKGSPPYEGSTRGRSMIFFAYGVLAASALGLKQVIVPENGLIAVNPPLTPRRLGSLSTRTTHPHLMGELNGILKGAGIGIELVNIFEGQSKGQMLASCTHPKRQTLAGASYSCGKGKRKNGQCGRCIPCIIRRASFHAAKVPDKTKTYFAEIARSYKVDDVAAARMGSERAALLSDDQFERWVAQAGPLPRDRKRRDAILGAVRTGLSEVSDYLSSIRWR